MPRLLRRFWPWILGAGFGAFVVSGYFRPELGAGSQIRMVMRLLGLSRPAARVLVVGLRKLGHLLGYAALALAVMSVLGRWGMDWRRRAGFTLLVVAAVATADEFIQSLIPWRGGLVSDAVLDLGAAALAVGLARARSAQARRRKTPEEA